MSNKEFETEESAMTLLLTKQKRWRLFNHPLRRNVVLLLFILFLLLVESIEAAASFIAQRHSVNDLPCPCSRAKSSIATRIHRTKCIPFDTVTCNDHVRRYGLFRLRTQPEDANDDGNDGNDMDQYHIMSSSQKQQQQQRQQQQQQQQENDSRSFEEKMDNFLDQEFFNPSSVDQKSPLKWFANLVERDYETAEALYASLIIVLLVVVSQELLRMQIIGLDHYVPFTRISGGPPGSGRGGGLW
jgi:hypothetical protein